MPRRKATDPRSRRPIAVLGLLAPVVIVAASPRLAAAAPAPPPPPEEQGSARPPGTTRPPPPPSAPAAGATRPDPLVEQVPTADLSKTWGYSDSTPIQPNYVKPAAEAALVLNPIGYYQGVTLDGENLPPFAPAVMGAAPAVLTWTGFEGEKGEVGSHVFLQLSTRVDPHVVTQPERVTLRLPTTSVNVRNNMRRLDTAYFRTPVTQVLISHDGSDTVIEIDLRRPATPTVDVRAGANGYTLLVVQFPPEGLSAGPSGG